MDPRERAAAGVPTAVAATSLEPAVFVVRCPCPDGAIAPVPQPAPVAAATVQPSAASSLREEGIDEG
jgi:hypothetical protein